MRTLKCAQKRILVYLLLFAMIATSINISQFRAEAAKKKKVTSISITKPEISKLTLKKGSSYRLKTKVLPKKATNKKVKFKSSKPSVASVTLKGVIKAKKRGTATISATSTDGSKKKVSVKVTVVNVLKKVSKVTLNTKSLTLYVDDDTQNKKEVMLLAKVSPGKATVKGVVYKTSNKSVVTVSKKGSVIAKKVGTANITVYAADGWGKKAVCKVNVKRKRSVSTAKPTSVPTLNPSANPTLIPTIEPTESPVETGEFIIASNKKSPQMYLDSNGKDYEGLKLIADCFADDVDLVSDANMDIITEQAKLKGRPIIAGSIGNNAIIDQLIVDKKLNVEAIEGMIWSSFFVTITLKDILSHY